MRFFRWTKYKTLKEPVKYYFAGIVRKGGCGGGTPQIRNSFFAENFVGKTLQSLHITFNENFPGSSLWKVCKGGRDTLISATFRQKSDPQRSGGEVTPLLTNSAKI